MRLRVGVLRAEGRAEGVHALVGQRIGFRLQLTRHGQRRRLAKEVVLRLVGFAHLLVGHGERVARAFRVVRGDQRRVHIHIAAALEVVMHRLRRNGADAEHGLKQTRARTQIGDVAQKFQRVALRLKRIVLRAVTQKQNIFHIQLNQLLLKSGLYNTCYLNARAVA